MRTPIVAGNWKMHKTIAEARHLVYEMVTDLDNIKGVEKVLCPPYMALMSVSELLQDKDIGIGAQNLHWEAEGAYTGEISPKMVAEICQYVIIGHSERRQYFGESDEKVNRKVKAALAYGLIPILCVGESLEENEAGRTEEVVSGQIRRALDGLSAASVRNLIVAYEPIWAIGTGKAATAEGADRVIAENIRGPLMDIYNEETAESVRIQYGGSVKPHNAAEFFTQPNIDGALVGGASLKAVDFVAITKAAV